MNARTVLATLAAAAALAGPRADAQDAEAPYFARAFPGTVQRVAAGPDGTVYAAGTTQLTALPGAIAPPVHPESYRHAFVSAWTPDGRLLWTSYLPFRLDWAEQSIRGFAAAPDGSVWVACASVLVGDGHYDEVGVARVASDGSILVTELLVGDWIDRASGLVVTAGGDAIVTGTTWSGDFPTTTPSSWDGVGSAAFAARIRADGSGIAWSRLVGAPGAVRCTAAAPDGSGGVVVALVEGTYAGDIYYYDNDLGRVSWVTDLEVARISPDGEDGGTTPLPHAFSAAVSSLAVQADGSLLAAGSMGYEPYGADAFVMRVSPATGAVTALSKEASELPARVVVEPSGSVLVGTDLRFVDPYYSYWYGTVNTSRLRRLTPDLRDEATLLDRDYLRSVEDFAVAPDGAVCVIGRGLAATFNPDVLVQDATGSFVARIPGSGAGPASAVEVARTTRDAAELSWSGGDAASSYEVEQLHGTFWSYDLRYTVAATAQGDARGAVVAGLTPGETYTFRLVSVFPSGVRSATAPFVVHSSPPTPSDLTAKSSDNGVVLRWSPSESGPNVRWELQRRIGSGPWRRISRSPWDPLTPDQATGWFVDGLPPLGAGTVRYRIRSSLAEGSGTSAWAYSDTTAIEEPSLRVRQTAGRVEAVQCSSGLGYIGDAPVGPSRRIQVSGTFGPAQDSVAPQFDAMRHDIRFWFGAPESPIGIRARAGNWWWKRTGATWTWSGWAENGVRCLLTIDPAEGTFSLVACTDAAADFGRNADTVLFGFSYGSWSGGEIRRWSRVAGAIRPNLVLR